MKLCFATNNRHKLSEVRQKLGSNFEILSLDELGFSGELPETQNTLEANSAQKAHYVFDKYGIDCFSDDTGLEVEALDGEPGVLSARYAGIHKDADANTSLLLKNLQGISNRKACFKTVITLLVNGVEQQFLGIVEGVISLQKKGEKGFGYDPVFVPDGQDKTFAEMPLDKKNQISHRAKAVAQLVEFLKKDNNE
jgi:XTP/dITP diphosphohydrolase